MNKSDLRPIVLDILRKTPQTHFRAVENDVRLRADGYERRDVLALNEVLWELLTQGVLAPGKNSLNPDLPFVHVTEYGTRCIEDGAILAHDPERYIERLKGRTNSKANSIVVESAREGLLTYLDGRYTAAVVLLAHAGECLLGELAGALVRSGRRTGHGTKRVEASCRAVERQAAAIERALLGRRPPKAIADETETQLAGLRELIRLVRADGGTPRIPSVDRDLTLAQFLLFPDRCRFTYHVMDWLEGKSGA